MIKHNNLAVTDAAKEAGRALSAFHAVEVAARKIIDKRPAEETPGVYIGIRISGGCIKDVIATNGAVRIEE